jgi:hypothetical protein
MPEMTIRLRINPETGKKDIIISMRADEEALPHEHEQQHRELVEKLLNRGILSEGEAGNLIIEREEEEKQPVSPVSNPPQGERRAQQAGH